MTIFSISVGIMLAVEAIMIFYFRYWSNNHPKTSYVIRTLTAIAIVTYVVMNGEYDIIDMVASFVIGFGVALDTVWLITQKGK